MGQNNVIIRLYYNFKNSNKFLNSIFLNWFFLSFVIIILTLTINLTLYYIYHNIIYLLCIIIVSSSIIATFRELHLMIYRVLHDIKLFLMYRISFQLLKFLLVLLLAYYSYGIYSYPIGVTIASTMILILEIKAIKRIINFNFLNKLITNQIYLSKLLFLFGLPLMLHAINNLLLINSDKFIIYYLIGEEAVGKYSFAYVISSSIVFFMYIIGLVYLPDFYKKHRKFTPEARRDLVNLTIKNFIFSAIVGIILLILLKYIVNFYDKTYLEILDFTYILIISYIIYPFYLYGNYKAMLLKKNKMIPYATFLTFVVNIFLNILLIPEFGLIGSAVATLIGNIILIITINIITIKKRNNYV
jgi:O-antigen/teichoic acid export membrane protein